MPTGCRVQDWFELGRDTLMIELITTKRTDERLLSLMKIHYSKPKGFVGRNICYAILYDNNYYGHIIGGSTVKHLTGRDNYFNINKENKNNLLQNIVNNIFYNINKIDDKYPERNFTTKVLQKFIKTITVDWELKYGNKVIGFETLVELPRKGELYLKDKWVHVGTTKGFTCKREGGKGTDSWSGKRVWDTKNLKPKIVLCKKI